MSRALTSLSAVSFALAAGLACSGKSEQASRDRPPADPDSQKDSGESSPVPSGPGPAAAKLPPEQEARYRKHLASGRKLARDQRWGEAMGEFEAALEAAPLAGRALSELGWAAFQAGDYDRARTANRTALRVSGDAGIRASSMYNLGRIAEALGKGEIAAQQYRASLALRPSEIVAAHLAGLEHAGSAGSKPGANKAQLCAGCQIDCGPSATVAELCTCLIGQKAAPGRRPDGSGKDAGAGDSEGPSCNRERRQVSGVELVFVGDEVEERVYLIARGPRGWSAEAVLGHVENPDSGGVQKELEIARMEIRRIAERKALWIESVQTRAEAGKSGAPVASSEVRALTLCAWTREGGDLECVLQLPLVSREDSGRALRRVEVAIDDDGTARVILAQGAKTDAIAPLVGEHTLW